MPVNVARPRRMVRLFAQDAIAAFLRDAAGEYSTPIRDTVGNIVGALLGVVMFGLFRKSAVEALIVAAVPLSVGLRELRTVVISPDAITERVPRPFRATTLHVNQIEELVLSRSFVAAYASRGSIQLQVPPAQRAKFLEIVSAHGVSVAPRSRAARIAREVLFGVLLGACAYVTKVSIDSQLSGAAAIAAAAIMIVLVVWAIRGFERPLIGAASAAIVFAAALVLLRP